MIDTRRSSMQPGTVIDGRYEVIKCLGAGSMGQVYACRHRELAGHMVAVKVLYPEVAQDKIASARFRNEIFAAYGVSHPNVVRAYEYIKNGDFVAYTMEYVGGSDLAARLEGGELLSIPEIYDILSQMCSGVQAIHDAGIVHRDLKPENILLSKDGRVKLADFGIAKTNHGPKLTDHGGVVGTIDYVSPEYMLNSQVDWRSDIYALGILAYEMITGESPFKGDSVYQTMTKRLNSDPVPPSQLRPDCPASLDRIILRAMERNPENRYQSAAEMFYDLQEGRSSGSVALSGTYLQVGQQNSGSYVGPAVAEDEDISGPPVGAARPQRNSGHYRSAATSAAFEETVPGYTTAEADVAGGMATVAVGPGYFKSGSQEHYDVVSQYQVEETTFQPMQRLLGRESAEMGRMPLVAGTEGGQVLTGISSIDETRVRRLQELVDKAERSTWVHVLTLICAIMIGVGLGYVILDQYFPDFLAKGSPDWDER